MKLLKQSFAFALLTISTLPAFAQSPQITIDPTAYSTPVMGIKKKVICTATINSDDEKKSFQKYLHPDYFEFVELVNGKTDTGFLKRSCGNSNLKCDVVLFSAHFGGGFTDNKRFYLPLAEMEKLSCGTCPSVLSDASMVYLFGCNTLAGKKLDGRTPEEYYHVLVDEVGLDPAEARATTAVRYSAIGDSFNDRIRRVFRGSKIVSGFDSKAPLGHQIQPWINAFFGGIATGLKQDGQLEDWERRLISEAYYNELEKIKAQQQSGEIQRLFDTSKPLTKFAPFMSPAYTEVPGIVAGSKEDFVAQKLCTMDDGKQAKLRAIEDIVSTGDRLSVTQMLPYLLEMSERRQKLNGDQKQFFARMSSNPALREIMTGPSGILSQLQEAPEELTKTVDLAYNLGWLSPEQQSAAYRKAAIYVWNNPSGFMKNKALMKRLDEDLAQVQATDIKPEAFKGSAIWEMIADRRSKNPDWLQMAKANIGITMNSYLKKYELFAGEIAQNPTLSPAGVKTRQSKMRDAINALNEVCDTAGSMKSIKAELPGLLAPNAQSFDALSIKKCSKLVR